MLSGTREDAFAFIVAALTAFCGIGFEIVEGEMVPASVEELSITTGKVKVLFEVFDGVEVRLVLLLP